VYLIYPNENNFILNKGKKIRIFGGRIIFFGIGVLPNIIWESYCSTWNILWGKVGCQNGGRGTRKMAPLPIYEYPLPIYEKHPLPYTKTTSVSRVMGYLVRAVQQAATSILWAAELFHPKAKKLFSKE
jgi:hypothetical protein